jgi:hypothetical protein
VDPNVTQIIRKLSELAGLAKDADVDRSHHNVFDRNRADNECLDRTP